MTMSRRHLLRDGTRVAAAIAVGPLLLRFRSCRRVSSLRHASSEPSIEAGVCTGRVSAAIALDTGPPLHPEKLAPFVDALPIPTVLAPEGERPDPSDPGKLLPFYRVSMRESVQQVHRDLPPTRFWTYGGQVPGPTIETRSNQGFLVEWANDLPERHFLPIDHTLHGAHDDQPEVRAVVHVHGAKAPPESD